MNEEFDIAVLHNVPKWLNLTESWIYTQVRHLPPRIEQHIYCGATLNLEQFGVPNIWCENEQPLLQRYWHKVRRRMPFGRGSALEYCASRCRARLLHSHYGPVGWRSLDVVRRLRIPHIVTFYGFDVSRLPNSWHHRCCQLL